MAAVLTALRRDLEADTGPDKTAPVRSAYRYIHNRLNQLEQDARTMADSIDNR